MRKAAFAADGDTDALQASIRENQTVAGSPATQRLEAEVEAEAKAAQNICGGCGAGLASKRCDGCAMVRYCGEQCQVAHWPTHKARCRVLKAEAAAREKEEKEEKEEERKEEEKEEEKEEDEVVHNSNIEAGNCWTCGADNPRNLCNRCKVTKYCGVACQTENWPIHKGRCKELKRQAAVVGFVKSELKKVKAGAPRSQEDINRDLSNSSLLGRVADIERIIAAGGDVNSHTSSEVGPLHEAAQEGHARAIGVLLRHGARVDARIHDGRTALHLAAQLGQLKAVAALLEHGAQIDLKEGEGLCALYMAAQFNHLEVVALLLRNGARVDVSSDL